MTLIYDVPLSCPAAQPLLPTSHQPKQNQVEGGTAKIKVNPSQLSEQMDHPVLNMYVIVLEVYSARAQDGPKEKILSRSLAQLGQATCLALI